MGRGAGSRPADPVNIRVEVEVAGRRRKLETSKMTTSPDDREIYERGDRDDVYCAFCHLRGQTSFWNIERTKTALKNVFYRRIPHLFSLCLSMSYQFIPFPYFVYTVRYYHNRSLADQEVLIVWTEISDDG